MSSNLFELSQHPNVKAVKRADVQPDDVIVIECHGQVNQETADKIKAIVHRVWPENRVLVMPRGLSMKIVDAIRSPN